MGFTDFEQFRLQEHFITGSPLYIIVLGLYSQWTENTHAQTQDSTFSTCTSHQMTSANAYDHRCYNLRFSHHQVHDHLLFCVCHNGFWCKLVLLRVHLCHLSPSKNIIVEKLTVCIINLIIHAFDFFRYRLYIRTRKIFGRIKLQLLHSILVAT